MPLQLLCQPCIHAADMRAPAPDQLTMQLQWGVVGWWSNCMAKESVSPCMQQPLHAVPLAQLWVCVTSLAETVNLCSVLGCNTSAGLRCQCQLPPLVLPCVCALCVCVWCRC